MMKEVLLRLSTPLRAIARHETRASKEELKKELLHEWRAELDAREKYACQNIELDRHHKALRRTTSISA